MPYTLCGAEVAFFPGISHADGIEQLCLAGTNTMLLEMPFAQWKENELREVIYLMDRGIHPLLAHIERFLPFQKYRMVGRKNKNSFGMPKMIVLIRTVVKSAATPPVPLRMMSNGIYTLYAFCTKLCRA